MTQMERKALLKEETRKFLGDLRNLVERSCADVCDIRLSRMFQKLWEAVGTTMREHPSDASRMVKRWAKGKLSAVTSHEALMDNKIMQPSSEDEHYARRGSLLIQLVIIRLFSEASEAFFTHGPEIFPSYSVILEKLKNKQQDRTNSSQSQTNSVSNSPIENDEGDDEILFDPTLEDDFELRLPLRSSFSQGSFTLTQKGGNSNKYTTSAADDDLILTRQNSSWSVGGRIETKVSLTWPITRLRVDDPISDISDIVMWLRLATIALDFTSSHTDGIDEEPQGGKKRKAAQKVYPFEQVLSEGICSCFALVFPKSLEAIYNELEISTQSSEPLAAALSLRKQIDNDHEVWGSSAMLGMPPQSPLTPLTPMVLDSNVLSFSSATHTKKRRKKKEASVMDTRDSLALELEKIHERKNIKVPSLSSRQPSFKIACR